LPRLAVAAGLPTSVVAKTDREGTGFGEAGDRFGRTTSAMALLDHNLRVRVARWWGCGTNRS